LTTENLEGFVNDDELAHAPLQALGWNVQAVPWQQHGVDWRALDAVVIRSTWDYQNAPHAFLSVLDQIERSGAHLENALEIVRWNMNKTYLRDLDGRGIPIVTTLWGADLGPVDERVILDQLGTEEAVIKPVIGANADHTYRLRRGSAAWRRAADTFKDRGYLVQPFIPSIITEGEYSLFFFNGELSHVILKTPKAGDFRVQEEHGGIIRAVPATSALVSAGERVLADVTPIPLYARVDLVSLGAPGYGLMELELIEPALYFRMDEKAAERFARALDWRLSPGATGGGV
jgi:glutathione synthase/RimK-type ligase-like ATP-grasp enzyme